MYYKSAAGEKEAGCFITGIAVGLLAGGVSIELLMKLAGKVEVSIWAVIIGAALEIEPTMAGGGTIAQCVD